MFLDRGKPSYAAKPARLRMNRMVQPLTSKVDFELFSLAVSAINGCGACMQAHEAAVLEGGLTEDHVHEAVRIAATVQAAASNIAFGTAWHMLITRARLRAGETVLVNSVGSGIGSAAVQVAKHAGAFVLGTSSRADKLERAKELGLDVAIDYTAQDVVEEVLRHTDGNGVDVVYEHCGGTLFQQGLDSLKKDGRLVVCGAHSGEVVEFDIIPFFRRQLSVIGSFVFDRNELETVFGLIANGALKPQVGATFPLEEAGKAMDLMESREFFGKIVLTAGGDA